MSTWAKKTAERIITLEGERAEGIVRSEEEKRLLLHHAPRRWQELREWLRTSCDTLNDETGRKILEFEVWPVSQGKIRRIEHPALLQIEFGQEACRVWYSCGAGKGEYQYGVNVDRAVVFQDAYHRELSVEKVGETLLNLLLESQF